MNLDLHRCAPFENEMSGSPCQTTRFVRDFGKEACMKRISFILRAYFSTLERSELKLFAGATNTPTCEPQTESASPRLYTGVLVGDFVSPVFLYSPILALRNFRKMTGVTRKRDHSSANDRRVPLSR
jgi:hypothetical protein